jgi:hypothetical protein
MGGYFPGIPGLAAFAAIKFGGYCLAAVALKKLQPVISASVLKIAAARTGLGIVAGPLLTFGLVAALAALVPRGFDVPMGYVFYVLVCGVRILIWAFVITIFTREIALPKSKLWSYAALGMLWSCLLDLPGYGLAAIAPGKIAIC